MNIKEEMFTFVDNFGNAFFVGSLITKKTLYINKIAGKIYGCTTETCDFSKIFAQGTSVMEHIITSLDQRDNVLLYNHSSFTADNTELTVDLHFGFFDKEKTAVFLEIIPQHDTRMSMAINQINESPRADAILNLDENLSIIHCNEHFHRVLESNHELRFAHFNNNFANGFPEEQRANLISDILSAMKSSNFFKTEVAVSTAIGTIKHYRLELQKRTLDDFGDKLMCHMVNIEEKVQNKEELSLLNEYLAVVQQSTVDLLYRVDVKTNTMYHFTDFTTAFGSEKVIPNYVEAFMKNNVIHPDDQQSYIKELKKFNETGEPSTVPIRFSIDNNEYKWYIITGKKIFDSNGEVTEVFGALVNVEDEVNIKNEFSIINQYFSATQKLTGHILFHIDIKTKVFRHADANAISFGIPEVIPNFVETFIQSKFIRPEDEHKYRNYINRVLSGEAVEYEIQAAIGDGVYEWFNIKNEFIYNDKGEKVEVFGVMENIQEIKNLELRANYDGLTSVQTIESFVQSVTKELENINNSINHALVFIDMDNFKYVNDTYGHQFGDFVLETFAKRLKNCVRETDKIGRMGGDEFVVYLKGVFSAEMAVERMSTLFERLETPISNGTNSHHQGASIGIALIPKTGITYEELYRRADKAAYQSKRNGKNTTSVYTKELDDV